MIKYIFLYFYCVVRSYSLHLGLIRSIWSYLVPFSPIWFTLVLCGPLWCYSVYSVHFDPIQSTLVLFCPFVLIRSIWSNSVHFDPIRSIRFYSVHVGPIWSMLFYSIQLGPLLSIFSNSVNYTNPYLLFIYYNQSFFWYSYILASHKQIFPPLLILLRSLFKKFLS